MKLILVAVTQITTFVLVKGNTFIVGFVLSLLEEKKMSRKFVTINCHEDVRDMLKFVASTQNISMAKCLEDILTPILQLLASYKRNSVTMNAYARVVAGEVVLAFTGKRTLIWGSDKEPEDIVQFKLAKVTGK